MAFTKQPEQSTYQTRPIKLLSQLDKRSADPAKDSDYFNTYAEIIQSRQTGDNDFHIVKRAGTAEHSDGFGSTNVRGGYHWEEQNKFFVAVDDDIQIYNSLTGDFITTLNNVFTTTSGDVGFTEFYYDNTAVKIVAVDGTDLITIDTANVVATSTDPDLPVPHLPIPIFLDGYLFLAKGGTADLYNSNLNDPLLWEPSDFISAEMFPDSIVSVAKMNNYLLAFGTYTVEYFWDAANPTGSPLQRNDTPVKLSGFLGGLAQYANQVIFVGNNVTGTPTIYMLQDFNMKDVGIPTVQKYLGSLDDLEPLPATILSFSGHDFYVMSIGPLTWVLDLKTEQWTRWGYQAQDNFPAKFAFNILTTNSADSVFYMMGAGSLFRMGQDLFQDNGVNFTMRIVTDNEFFDSYNQKTMNRLSIMCDRPTSSASMNVSWTDDDYQTYNSPRSVELNQELPKTDRLGRFRRRAFKLEFTANHPMRVKALEVDINLGNW